MVITEGASRLQCQNEPIGASAWPECADQNEFADKGSAMTIEFAPDEINRHGLRAKRVFAQLRYAFIISHEI